MVTDWTRRTHDDGSPKDWCERVEACLQWIDACERRRGTPMLPTNKALREVLADGQALARELSEDIAYEQFASSKGLENRALKVRIAAMQRILDGEGND